MSLQKLRESVDTMKSTVFFLAILLTLPFTINQYWKFGIWPFSETEFYKNTFIIAIILIAISTILYYCLILLADSIHCKNKYYGQSILKPAVVTISFYLILSKLVVFFGLKFNTTYDLLTYVIMSIFLLSSLFSLYFSYAVPVYKIKELFEPIVSSFYKLAFGFSVLYILLFLNFDNFASTINNKLISHMQKQVKVPIKSDYCDTFPSLKCQKINKDYSLATLNVYFESNSFVYISLFENNTTIIRSIAKDDILGKTLPQLVNK